MPSVPASSRSWTVLLWFRVAATWRAVSPAYRQTHTHTHTHTYSTECLCVLFFSIEVTLSFSGPFSNENVMCLHFCQCTVDQVTTQNICICTYSLNTVTANIMRTFMNPCSNLFKWSCSNSTPNSRENKCIDTLLKYNVMIKYKSFLFSLNNLPVRWEHFKWYWYS